jgi:D-amino-acid dehydrogenase
VSGQTDSVLIVGGGVIGIACAHYLRKRGYKVTIIEKDEIGAACSQGNLGYVCPSHVLPLTEPGAIAMGIKSLLSPRAPFRIKPQLRASLLTWMWQFAKRCTHRKMLQGGRNLQGLVAASSDEYRRLLTETSIDVEWKESGLLFVFQTERGLQKYAATDDLLSAEFGLASTRLDGGELNKFEPATRPGLAGAFRYDTDAFLRPEKLNLNWARSLEDDGVEIVENCELRNIEKQSGRIAAVITSDGPMQADQYVFATGAWSGRMSDMLDCRIPVEPGKGYSMTMTRSPHCPSKPMLFPEHHVGVTPFDDGYRLGSIMEFAGFDASIPDFRMQQLRDSAAPYLKEPGGHEIVERWYGWRPMTWDSLPIIGRLPRLANGILATGHNMLGVTLAPVTGKLVAEIAAETRTFIDTTPFSPDRFN